MFNAMTMLYVNDFPQTTEKFPDVTPQWDSITTALEPFSANPSLDPSTQYMVPRPETSELDGVIGQIEEQLSELQVRAYSTCPYHYTHCQFNCTFLTISPCLH